MRLACQELLAHLLRPLQSSFLPLREDLKSKHTGGVLVFFRGPVPILGIEADPVVLNVFININIADLKVREACVELLHDFISEDQIEDKYEQKNEERPGWLFRPTTGDELIKYGVISNIRVSH